MEKYSLLSVEMTATRTPLRKKIPSCRVGHGEKFLLSSAKNTWMEEKVSYFHGTRNTDQFTKKHCCITLITLILIKRKRNLFWSKRKKKKRFLKAKNRYMCMYNQCFKQVQSDIVRARTFSCRASNFKRSLAQLERVQATETSKM